MEKSQPILIRVFRSCSACTKKETIEHHKWCTACKVIRYCAKECQEKDWERHKKTCKKIIKRIKEIPETLEKEERKKQLEAIQREFIELEEAYIEKLQQPFHASLETLTSIRSKALPIFPEQRAEVVKQLSLYGRAYTDFLRENCYSALARNNDDELAKNIDLYLITYLPEFLDEFPRLEQGTVQFAFRQWIFSFEYFGSRIPKAKIANYNELMETKGLAMLKKLEANRKLGSLFRNKGYPLSVKEALEYLRKEIMLKFLRTVTPDFGHSESSVGADVIMISVYCILCAVPCLNPAKTRELIKGIMEQDHTTILDCLQHDTIMRHAFLTDNQFLVSVNDTICPIEEFGEQISTNFIQKKCGDLNLPRKLAPLGNDDPFYHLMVMPHPIPYMLAKLYCEK